MTRTRLTEAEGRALLLAAATEIITETGSPNITVREVASRAGINHGLVHRYFGTKDALISAVIAEISRTVAEELADPTREGDVLRSDGAGTLARLIGHAMISGGEDGTEALRSAADHPVASVLIQRCEAAGLDEKDSRLAAAQIMALGLGWRLNEQFLVTACGLEDSDVETLRSDLRDACLQIARARVSLPVS
ncbi:TetR/AcrR family transcriptional regulator [soil metagenome]